MRPTAARLVRIIPRSALNLTEQKVKVLPRPTPQFEEYKKPTTIDILFQQKEKAGDSWPPNIRIEPAVRKAAFASVKPEYRKPLKQLLKEA